MTHWAKIAKRPKDMTLDELEALPVGPRQTPLDAPGTALMMLPEDIMGFHDSAGEPWLVRYDYLGWCKTCA